MMASFRSPTGANHFFLRSRHSWILENLKHASLDRPVTGRAVLPATASGIRHVTLMPWADVEKPDLQSQNPFIAPHFKPIFWGAPHIAVMLLGALIALN